MPQAIRSYLRSIPTTIVISDCIYFVSSSKQNYVKTSKIIIVLVPAGKKFQFIRIGCVFKRVNTGKWFLNLRFRFFSRI